MLNLNSLEILRSWLILPLIMSTLGLFLSCWIIIPAPTWSLLPFGVGAPELSPWLIVLNAIALILAAFLPRIWWSNLIVIISLASLLVSLLPLLSFSAVNQAFQAEIERVLGTNYLDSIPQTTRDRMRSQPLSLIDVFLGIPQSEIRINRGIIFASPDQTDLKLNIYRSLTEGKKPTVIIIYGGAWREGSPDDYEQFSYYMAAQEYTVITIDYRHAPEHQFPKQLEDVETALYYIQAHANDLEVDLTKMAVMGRSAGGHLATLAAYRQNTIHFKAVVNYYAPVDLADGYYDLPTPDPIDVQTILDNFIGGSPEEKPELYEKASLTNYLRPDLPPSLLIYARRDHLVMSKFGRWLYDKLRATDNQVVYLEIPWAEHAFDAVFFGVSNQLALYHTERFLASTMNN